MLNYIKDILFKRGCALPSWTPLVFFLKIRLQIISKISADLISSNFFGNKSEFRPRFMGTDYIRAKFAFDFFMKKTQSDFQTKNARIIILYHSSRTMTGCKHNILTLCKKRICPIVRRGGYYPSDCLRVIIGRVKSALCIIGHIHFLHLIILLYTFCAYGTVWAPFPT